VQLAVILLERDLEQASPRPVESELGNLTPAFIGTSDSIELTRNGYFNTLASTQQSHLIRVAYQGGGALTRKTWPVLDLAPGTEASSRVLLSTIGGLRFDYLDSKNKWHDKWPRTQSTNKTQTNSNTNSNNNSNKQKNDNAETSFPKAVKVTLTLPERGDITLLIPIPVQQSESGNKDDTK